MSSNGSYGSGSLRKGGLAPGPERRPAHGTPARPCRGRRADVVRQVVLQLGPHLRVQPERGVDELGDVEEGPFLLGAVRLSPQRRAAQVLPHQQGAGTRVTVGHVPVAVPVHRAQPLQDRAWQLSAHFGSSPSSHYLHTQFLEQEPARPRTAPWSCRDRGALDHGSSWR